MIKTWEEYNELEAMYDEANDRIISGAWASGIHFQVLHVLSRHGVYGSGREGGVNALRKLLDEFVQAQLMEAE